MANNIQRLYSMQRLYSGSRDIRHDGTFDSSASDDDQDEQPGDDQDEQPEDDQDEQPDDEQPDDDQDEQSERSSPTMIEIENARQEELKMRRKTDDAFMQERRETDRMSREDPLATPYMRWSRSHRGWVDELLTETDEEPQPDKKPEFDNKSDAQPEEQPELDTKSDAKPEEQPEPDTTSDAKPEETPDQPEPALKILRLGVRAHG